VRFFRSSCAVLVLAGLAGSPVSAQLVLREIQATGPCARRS
jgi:hypothetical protein